MKNEVAMLASQAADEEWIIKVAFLKLVDFLIPYHGLLTAPPPFRNLFEACRSDPGKKESRKDIDVDLLSVAEKTLQNKLFGIYETFFDKIIDYF